MYMKNFGKGIGGALLSLAFVLGIFTATSGTAQAQYRNDNDVYQRDHQDDDREDRKRDARRRRQRDDRNVNNQGDWRRNRTRTATMAYRTMVYDRNGGYGNNGGYNNNGIRLS